MRNKIKTIIVGIFCLIVFIILVNISSNVYSTSLETNYTADYGTFEGELYFNVLRDHTSLFCNKENTPFFFKRDTRIVLSGSVNGTPFSVDVTSGGSFNIWSVSHGSCTYSKSVDMELNAELFSGMGLSSIESACSPTKGAKTIYATGKTNYKLVSTTSVSNDRYAYIINEAPANTPGLHPDQSQPNHAWWSKDSSSIIDVSQNNDFDDESYNSSSDYQAKVAAIEKERTDAISSIDSQIQALENTRNKEQSSLNILLGKSDEAAQLTEDIKALKSQNESLQNQINDLNNQKKSYNDQINQCASDINRLNSEINTLQSEIANLNNQINTLNAQLIELENQRQEKSDAGEDVTDIDAQITAVRNQITDANSQISQKQSSINSKYNEISSKNSIINSYNQAISDIDNDISFKKSQIENNLEEIEEKESLIANANSSDDDNPSDETLKAMISAKENKIAEINRQIEALNQRKDEINKTADEQLKYYTDLGNVIDGSTVISDRVGYSSYSGEGILHEALIFEQMHKIIQNNYQDHIKDNTNVNSVLVSYDSTTQKYTVGPFNISYVEVYAYQNQFAGITGTPKLTLSKNGQKITKDFGNGWTFGYSEARKQTATTGDAIPSGYNTYPHTGENFYFIIDYEEGIEKIEGLQLQFRNLTASGTYQVSEGTVEKWKWTVGSPTFSKCYAYLYTCHHHGENSSRSCHDVYCHKYDSASVYVTKSRSDDIPIQPVMRVVNAQRGYALDIVGSAGADVNASSKFYWGIDLTTTLAGDVWGEIAPQKSDGTRTGAINGIKDSIESGLPNIIVTVYVSDGKNKKVAFAHETNGAYKAATMVTAADGHYEFKRIEAPGSYKNGFYIIEFQYDGQVYRHTVFMGDSSSVRSDVASQRTASVYKNNKDNYSRSSMAVETVAERATFDRSFGEITGNSAIGSNLQTSGTTYTTDGNGNGKGAEGSLLYKGKTVDDSVSSELQSPANTNTTVTDTRYKMTASTYYDDTDAAGLVSSKNDFRIKYPLEGTTYTLNAVKQGDRRYIGNYMLHINLGLQERAYTDMSVLKDLYKVTMVVNEQKVTKQFNSLGTTSNDSLINSDYDSTLKAALEQRKQGGEYKYSLGLYSTDLAYQSYQRYKNAIQEVIDLKAGTELKVYVTYVVRVYNNSETNDVELNSIMDYYDEAYTLVAQDVSTSIVDEKLNRSMQKVADAPYYRIMSTTKGTANNVWQETKEQNLDGVASNNKGSLVWTTDNTPRNTIKYSSSNSLDGKKIHTNEYVEIFTTYEVDQEGYLEMSKNKDANINTRNDLLGEKQNIAEIQSYTTFYTSKDHTTGDRMYTAFDQGWVSGRVDRDSAPNNIDKNDIKNRNKYEDDTDRSIPLNISIDTYERDMYGYVWKDNKNVDTGSYGIKVGNGLYDAGEELVQNVEVTMYEVINLGKFNNDGSYNSAYDSFDYYYKVPTEFYNYSTKNAYNTGNTDSSGNAVKTLSTKAKNIDGTYIEGNYYIYGYLAGDYILRFDYGTKSSKDTDATIYSTDQNGETTTRTEKVSTYNGQDYENTKFLDGQLDTLNDKYLDLTAKIDGKSFIDTATSKARDNESRRMVVDAYSRTIENDRAEILRDRYSDEFIESTRMFAETPIMQIEIEDPRTLEKPSNDLYQEKVEKDSNKRQQVEQHRYTIKNINFGLEERANTDIKLEKYIESISMIKSGEVIFNATMLENGEVIKENTNAMHLDKLTYLSHEKAGLVQQGFYAIAVEDDYLNDLTLKITYKIKLRNTSEVDFTGKLANLYRAEEIVDKATIVPTDKLTENIINNMASDEGVASNATLTEIMTKNDANLNGIVKGDNISTNANDDTIRPKVIIYGRYVGRFYYENAISETRSGTVTVKSYLSDAIQNPTVIYPADKIVTTTVDQVVDYIDIDASLDDQSSIANATWNLSGLEKEANGYNKSLNGLLSKSSYRKISDTGLFNIYDDKDREYINDTRSNIAISYNERLDTLQKHREMSTTKYNDEDAGRVEYLNGVGAGTSRYNTDLTRELVPESYRTKGDSDTYSEVRITVAKTASSGTDANQMKIDNLAEVLVYSNPTGRRDTNSVPGNAMAIVNHLAVNNKEQGVWYAGFNSEKYWDGKTAKENWTQYPENDAWSPEYVTVIAPTGIALRTYIKNYIVPIAILVGTIVIMMIMFGVKQVQIFRKRKED